MASQAPQQDNLQHYLRHQRPTDPVDPVQTAAQVKMLQHGQLYPCPGLSWKPMERAHQHHVEFYDYFDEQLDVR